MSKETVRINKYLALLGIAARRQVDEWISAGKVLVNGEKAVLGQQINPDSDTITVNGESISQDPQAFEYWAVYKPTSVVSTVVDPEGRPTVTSLVESEARLYPVGRLDYESEGLILLTNDGGLAYRLTHPRFHVPKTYIVTVMGKFSDSKKRRLETGVRLTDGVTAPAEVEIFSIRDRRSSFKITIHEGRKRQIRRMCSALNLEVIKLKRISIGPLELQELAPGESRTLTETEISDLKAAAGLV